MLLQKGGRDARTSILAWNRNFPGNIQLVLAPEWSRYDCSFLRSSLGYPSWLGNALVFLSQTELHLFFICQFITTKDWNLLFIATGSLHWWGMSLHWISLLFLQKASLHKELHPHASLHLVHFESLIELHQGCCLVFFWGHKLLWGIHGNPLLTSLLAPPLNLPAGS